MLHEQICLVNKTNRRLAANSAGGAGLLKWVWLEILGSVKGQLAETLDSGQSFGCRPMTLSGLKSVDQQIRPPLAAPLLPFLAVAALGSFRGNLPKGAWKA
jgi:hypothetical protein